jgi:hypothetical protein
MERWLEEENKALLELRKRVKNELSKQVPYPDGE